MKTFHLHMLLMISILPMFLGGCTSSAESSPVSYEELTRCRPLDYTESWIMALDLLGNEPGSLSATVNVMYESVEGLHIRVYPYTFLSESGLPIHEPEHTDLEFVWRCEGTYNHLVWLSERRFGIARTRAGSPFPLAASPPPTWEWTLEYENADTVSYTCSQVNAQGYLAGRPTAEVLCVAQTEPRGGQIKQMRWYLSPEVRFLGFEFLFADNSGLRATLRYFESQQAPIRLLPR